MERGSLTEGLLPPERGGEEPLPTPAERQKSAWILVIIQISVILMGVGFGIYQSLDYTRFPRLQNPLLRNATLLEPFRNVPYGRQGDQNAAVASGTRAPQARFLAFWGGFSAF